MGEAKPWLAWNEWWFGCATLEEARKAAAEALESSRQQALYGYGWADDTDRIGWGVQLVHCVEHNRQPARCPYCEQGQGTPHLPDCDDFEEEHPERVVSLEQDFLCDYRLEPVPGAIEAVLGLASDEQLRAEVERREMADKGTLIDVLSSTATDLGKKVEALEAAMATLLEPSDEDVDRLWQALCAAPRPAVLTGDYLTADDLAEAQRAWDRPKVRALLATLRTMMTEVTRG